MAIGSVIKKLRRERDITQEQLAEYLGITSCAISQWECDKTAPDISQLPILANFFNISADELLGIDITKKKEKIDAVIAEYNRLSNSGKEKEKFDFISKAHREYPGDYKILDKYIQMLCYDPNHNGNGLIAHEEEITSLCDMILDKCPVDSLRFTALSTLGGLYREKGNIEKALEYANRFPTFYLTSGEEIENCYETGTVKWWASIRNNIYDLTGFLSVKIRNCALDAPLPPDGRIKLFKKAVDLIKLVYDDGDYGFSHYNLCELYIWIANRYIEMKDYDNAAQYLNLGLENGKLYDELQPVTKHTSFLVRDHLFETSKVYSGFEGNEIKRELSYINQNDFYNEVREQPWFKSILDKYKPFAKDVKG
jgi:Predicted transcriptional regulators